MREETGRTPATVGEAVRAMKEALRAAGVSEAAAKAGWAVADLIGVGRANVYLQAHTRLTSKQQCLWVEQCRRLAAHEPLQYVLGETEFYGRRFVTDQRALIPRPETEELVRLALESPELSRKGAAVADVGTGSGVIAVTLALQQPGAHLIGVDCSWAALSLAMDNAQRHGVAYRIQWQIGNLLAGFAPRSLDVVIANLPYVPTAVWRRLERQIRDFEPRKALDGGPDGLRWIRRLIPQAACVLRSNGLLLLEIGDDQGARVRRFLESAGFAAIEIRRDLAGRDRFALGRVNMTGARPSF